jgi:hypothetical protein
MNNSNALHNISGRLPKLIPEVTQSIRRRFLQSGESVAQLSVAFNSPEPAIRRALGMHPKVQIVRQALDGQRAAAIEECLSDSLKAAEWYEKSRLTLNPMASFLGECTESDPSGEVLKEELFDAWCKWSEERRISQIGKGRFLERVRSNAPYAISDTYEKGGHKFSVFRGIRLNGRIVKTPATIPSEPSRLSEEASASAGFALTAPVPTSVPCPTRQCEAWEYVMEHKGGSSADNVLVSWLVACQTVGGNRLEETFTLADWARVRDMVIHDLNLNPTIRPLAASNADTGPPQN